MQKAPSPKNQFTLRLDHQNPLASALREGRFLILLECHSPAADQPFESALAVDQAIARRLRDVPDVLAMAVTDRLRGEDCHDAVDTAHVLAESSGKAPVLHVSGKGSSVARVRDIMARAGSAGFQGVVAVTGDRSNRHVVRPGARRAPAYDGGYLDSVDILRLGQRAPQRLLLGAAINPFKYNPADQYLQYYKALRKLASGADFLVSQAGWDMKKLQELQWYLQMREVGAPVIARLALLGGDEIARLHEGFLPGVPVARSFAAMLQRESNINQAQSLSAQLHRLGLQVAGCQLLGYNGVQIAGIRSVQALDMVLGRIRAVLGAPQSYPDWLAAWNDFHSYLAFDPIPDAYYVFSGLLTAEHRVYEADSCRLVDRELPRPSWSDRARAALLPRMLAPNAPQALAAAVRRVAFHDSRTASGRLGVCEYLSPAACPKRLVCGACGGSQADGTCEFGQAPCFFHRVLAVAAKRHRLDALEDGLADD